MFLECMYELISNKVLITAGISWVIAQIIKVILTLCIERKLDLGRLFGDGGMPSAHTATVFSLAILTGWYEGYSSVTFAVAMIFAIVVMHDATGVRREAGKHALSIKEMADAINQLFQNKDQEIKTEKLKVLIGHTRLQVFFGAIVGFLTALTCILLYP